MNRRTADLRVLRNFAASLFGVPRARPAQAAGLMLFGGLLEGMGLFLLVPLVGLLVAKGRDSGASHAQVLVARLFADVGADTEFARLCVLLILFVPVVLLRTLVLTIRDRRLATLQLAFTEHHRVSLVRALASARWQDVADLQHARVTGALGADIGRLSAAAHYLLQLTVGLVMLTTQWLIALLIAPALASFALILAAIGAVVLLRSLGDAGRLGEDLVAGQLRLLHGAGQFLAGLKQAAAQNAQAAFVNDIETEIRSLTSRQLIFERRQSLARAGTAGISTLLGAAVLAIGVWLAVPVASLLAAVVVLARMGGPAVQIRQAAQQLATLLPAHASIDTLRGDLESAPKVPSIVVGSDRERQDEGVVFVDVSYAHGGNGRGVSDLSLTLFPGDIVAVTGPSGAGKTTFADLLSGLLEPDAGTITVWGVPLSRATARSLRDRIAYVTQDGFLIDDTIRRNLVQGSDGTPDGDAALWTALERVGAGDLVRRMPRGLDTRVAERGSRLSGGERQRLALASALLRDPALLILDEATGAIDIDGEAEILATLAADPLRPIIVIVAHRLETLAFATRVLALSEGRLTSEF